MSGLLTFLIEMFHLLVPVGKICIIIIIPLPEGKTDLSLCKCYISEDEHFDSGNTCCSSEEQRALFGSFCLDI